MFIYVFFYCNKLIGYILLIFCIFELRGKQPLYSSSQGKGVDFYKILAENWLYFGQIQRFLCCALGYQLPLKISTPVFTKLPLKSAICPSPLFRQSPL